MRRLLSLPALVALTWTAWLGLYALMASLVLLRVPHPHFLPATLGLALLFLPAFALVLTGSWRLARGPRRRLALASLLVGTAPLLLFAGHALYGLRAGLGRIHRVDWPLKLLVPLGESVMDLEARFRYPRRTVGRKVVMISAPMDPAEARRQVAAMDEHVERLESVLGLEVPARIHWARGPLMGMEGKAAYGLCMGSRPGTGPLDAEGLNSLDRHEVAHLVLEMHCGPRSQPPSILQEGWAQSHMGLDPLMVAVQALEFRRHGYDWPLRTLFGPQWSGSHLMPVYTQGAALVNYLLEAYGPEKFVKLYTTSRRDHFEADARRILGVDLDALDAAYRADCERRLDGHGPPERLRLERVELAPGVDRAAWLAFLDDECAAVAQLREPYRNIRLTSELRFEPEGSPPSTVRYESAHSGPFHRLQIRYPEAQELLVAHPRHAFAARRESSEPIWTLREGPGGPDRGYRHQLARIAEGEHCLDFSAPLLSYEILDRVDLGHLVLAGFQRVEGEIRLRLEDRSRETWAPWRTFELRLAGRPPHELRSWVSTRESGGKTATSRCQAEYERLDGVPLLKSYRIATTNSDGTRTSNRLTVLDRRFEAAPEAEFTREALLGSDPVRRIVDDPFEGGAPPAILDWYGFPLAAGVLGLLLGASLWPRVRHLAETDKTPAADPSPGIG